MNPWQSGVGGIFLSKFAPDEQELLVSTGFGSSQNLSESTPAGDALTRMSIGSDGTVFLAWLHAISAFSRRDQPALFLTIVPSGYASGISYMFVMAIDPTLSKSDDSVFPAEGFLTAAAYGPMNHLYVAGTSTLLPFSLVNQVVSDISTGGFYMELDQLACRLLFLNRRPFPTRKAHQTMAVDAAGAKDPAGLGSTAVGSVVPNTHFGFPGEPDPILVGPGVGGGTGGPLAIISPANSPQLSVDTVGPFLTLRNAGYSVIHISDIALRKRISEDVGQLRRDDPETRFCILTVSDGNGLMAIGSVTITSGTRAIRPDLCG